MEARELGSVSSTWLTQEGFSIEQAAKSGFSSFFTIYSPKKPDYRILVSQTVGDDKVMLSAGVVLGNNEKNRLKQVPEESYTELVITLSGMLHERSVPFQIDQDQGVISQVLVSKAVYSDGFTKDRLMTAVNELFSTQTMIVLTLAQYFMSIKQSGEPKRVQTAPSNSCSSCGTALLPNAKFCGSCGHKVV